MKKSAGSRKSYWTMDTLRILFLNKYPRGSRSFHAPSCLALTSVPVYLRVTYTGKAALTLERNLRIAVENCYGSVALRIVFVSRQMLPASRKNVLPAIQKSSVIYEYKCHCDVGSRVEQLNDFKTASGSMFRNGYDSKQPSSECNLTERASENNPLQNVTRQ